MIIFLLLFKKPTLTSGQFSVIGPERLIQAPLGGEAELPCYLSPPQSAQHMEVVWLQSTRVVHLYQDGEDQFGDQAPDYQGRTELVRDAITNGNVTLKIRDVRLLDAGRYKCLIADHFHQEEADMELKVSGEETVSQSLPPIYFLLIMMVCVVMYLIFLSLMLVFQVYFRRSKPWMGEISGVLVLTCAFEIEMCIFYLWIRHRCRGFYFDETSLWKEWKFAAAIILLLITKLIPIILQTIYFLQQRPCCSTQSVPRADNKVST
ncbi:myelin-oligodendrocyte glycoprotein-like isoform X2 [Petaurus breviceps papuanus]